MPYAIISRNPVNSARHSARLGERATAGLRQVGEVLIDVFRAALDHVPILSGRRTCVGAWFARARRRR
ncbi:hypothetical protein J7F02_21070 [Streptomyces sp. ISL-112]|nr:hypothetical protein [Streptomyces sp. ISL-112]MBT2463128.1 hypothetical protein [Streptomyces sp. ISL-63]